MDALSSPASTRTVREYVHDYEKPVTNHASTNRVTDQMASLTCWAIAFRRQTLLTRTNTARVLPLCHRVTTRRYMRVSTHPAVSAHETSNEHSIDRQNHIFLLRVLVPILDAGYEAEAANSIKVENFSLSSFPHLGPARSLRSYSLNFMPSTKSTSSTV